MEYSKDKDRILREALSNLEHHTPITALSPGSVARALTEVVANEVGDLYAALDYSTAMSVISTAQGAALDRLGSLYRVERKRLGEALTIEQMKNAFYFYIDSPHIEDITVPSGTVVGTDAQNFVGDAYTYTTARTVSIPAGRTRVYVDLNHNFNSDTFVAGKNTITRHNFYEESIDVYCTNPKEIPPVRGLENDANYRIRIVNALRMSSGGTSVAVRFRVLGIEGVRDVVMRPSAYGLGSTELLVVPEDRRMWGSIVQQVDEAIDEVAPVGVRMYVKQPEYVVFDIRATITVRSRLSSNPDATAGRVMRSLRDYINTLLPNERMLYSHLTQAALDASEAVGDVAFGSLLMDGVQIQRTNYTPKDGQQIVPGEISVSVAR